MARARKGFSRSDRLADQIQRDLAALLRAGLKDPRAGWITLTSVHVTRDYSHATIYYTVMESDKREVTQEALDSAAGYLRTELGRGLNIYSVPQLHFVYDESIERGMHMSRLIDQVASEDAARGGLLDDSDADEGINEDKEPQELGPDDVEDDAEGRA
ncbi:30S ribosome-binding factor RbfA [Paludibacterium paludis]|uniref:Ribosome-binding factor A n=1 Tax=Paludibacterium paludis TaxID=1225769 RepID=A0A918P481_9NEIS|nr:30S ribosome-binding factor RbfA [Paludibacterium paludis]GGY18960.1 ribosome-binding factor A [Paludibacterium paludis]